MKLLVDMNLSPRWVELFTREHIEALHWSNAGRVEALDVEVMRYAADHGFVVLTQDLDFSAILAVTQGTKPSVVQIRSDNLDPDAIGTQIIAAVRQLESELNAGAIASVEPHRTRVRLLPLQQP